MQRRTHTHTEAETLTHRYTHTDADSNEWAPKTCAFKQVNKDLKGFGCQTHILTNTHTHVQPTHTHTYPPCHTPSTHILIATLPNKNAQQCD